MPKERKASTKKIGLQSYNHKGTKRKNNPPVGLVSSATDYLDGTTTHKHDPHVDPHLSWAGKKEGTEIEVRNLSLHIHERIDAERIARGFLKRLEENKENLQPSLFQLPDNEPALSKEINFYGHNKDWANRLIAGDSLLVMNSLLNKEGMAGKVQMVYIDPPYGIKYNSNFQPFTNKRGVKDNNDADIPAEPEMIKAFRDTWELGIHSYLTHLYNRLLLAKELLHSSGSVFVQISDENVHHVREICDEVFGKTNFIAHIVFTKAAGGLQAADRVGAVVDHLVWYAKEKEQVKYRAIYDSKTDPVSAGYTKLELKDGTRRSMTEVEKNTGEFPEGSRPYGTTLMTKPGPGSKFDVEFNGRIYDSGNRWWGTTPEGIKKIIEANRVEATENAIRFVTYYDDFPYRALSNLWSGFGGAASPIYVVQTNKSIIERCLLLTTDPGDLVFDATCGSGTTAFVAEQWGRRWITCDTSRVAITLAKQRLMTAYFDSYELAHPEEGVRSGFVYKTVPHTTMASIANNAPPENEILFNQPKKIRDIVRVSGPFTMEAVPSVRVKPIDGKLPELKVEGDNAARAGDTGNQAMWRDELRVTGVRTIGGKKIEFSTISPMRATKYLDAEGEILEGGNINKKAVISFGPDFGPIEQRQVEEAIKEARSLAEKPDFVIFAAFHFDPEAAKDIDHIKWDGVQLLKVQMSVDLLTHDLRKKKRENQSYWLIGQPDIEVINDGSAYRVRVNGFDYYNPVSGEVESESSKKIAMWMLDTDYDERSLFPEQVFFPQGDKKRDWTKLAKALNGEVDQEAIEKFTGTDSLPFFAGQYNKIAVKIIDDRGIESLVIKELP
jgi:adenine-specific DNA-methyltransferase